MKNILKPSKLKLILTVLLFFGFFLAAITVPAFGLSENFSRLDLAYKIMSFFLSAIMCVIYYPLVASLVYLASCLKNSTYKTKEIILALIFIAIFNPLTVSVIVSKILSLRPAATFSSTDTNNNVTGNNVQPESSCGLMIGEIMASSKINNAGIEKGDVIVRFNGVEIKSVQDIFSQLDKKRPGDTVSVETNRGLKMVELARDPNDPNHPVLGVKLLPNPCGK